MKLIGVASSLMVSETKCMACSHVRKVNSISIQLDSTERIRIHIFPSVDFLSPHARMRQAILESDIAKCEFVVVSGANYTL